MSKIYIKKKIYIYIYIYYIKIYGIDRKISNEKRVKILFIHSKSWDPVLNRSFYFENLKFIFKYYNNVNANVSLLSTSVRTLPLIQPKMTFCTQKKKKKPNKQTKTFLDGLTTNMWWSIITSWCHCNSQGYKLYCW